MGILRAATGFDHRYTRSEVERMTGVSRRELEYWTRLRLVLPLARWGERFFSFSDLVALETIKRLAAHQVPAGRIRRTINALESKIGETRSPLSMLRISTNGKQLVVHSNVDPQPFEPLTGQFVLNFETSELAKRVHAMASRSAEEWFEIGMERDTNADTLEESVEAYRKAASLAPDWVEAHINLGTALYQLNRMGESKQEFLTAVELEPENPLAEFNLGCVLEQLGELDEAIQHLLRATELSPSLADAHLNLALAFDRRSDKQSSVRHLSAYLKYEPNGPWAEFARSRIDHHREPPARARSGSVTPFRKIGYNSSGE